MATDALRPSGDPHLPILSRGRRALRPYYFSDAPVQARWGSKYIPINRPFAAFLADCAAGTLPQVAFVDSRFIDELSGTSADDHLHADVRNGEASLDTVYKAVTLGPGWSKTALVNSNDEWGGFFDHLQVPADRRSQL